MSNYAKLKTNLKLAIQRLKLLEKKKTELSLKSRKEIADYLAINKIDRARIKVEHIIREDNYVEAMEMLEMFCDVLLARFGLIEKMKELDPGLDESIATIIWASPRVSGDVLEFKTIADVLSAKYGRKYAEACKADSINNVNDKVKRRLGLEAPPKILVEQYLIEIAKNFNVPFVPDNSVMLSSGLMSEELISLRDTVNDITRNNNNNNDSNSGGSAGPGPQTSYQPPQLPQQTASNYHMEKPCIPIGFNEKPNENLIDLERDLNNNNRSSHYPELPGSMPVGDVNRKSLPPAYDRNVQPEGDENDYDNAPALPQKTYNSQQNTEENTDYYQSPPPSYNTQDQHPKVPQMPHVPPANNDDEDELVLPSVPSNNFASAPDPNASIEFDDLAKRFENLKNFK